MLRGEGRGGGCHPSPPFIDDSESAKGLYTQPRNLQASATLATATR
jgi:hypothetical protein